MYSCKYRHSFSGQPTSFTASFIGYLHVEVTMMTSMITSMTKSERTIAMGVVQCTDINMQVEDSMDKVS